MPSHQIRPAVAVLDLFQQIPAIKHRLDLVKDLQQTRHSVVVSVCYIYIIILRVYYISGSNSENTTFGGFTSKKATGGPTSSPGFGASFGGGRGTDIQMTGSHK